MFKTEPTVLKSILAVNLDVNIWSARRKLQPGDFVHSELPPEKLASLGSKRICNPSDLKVFSTLKARAVNVLDKSGVRFLGGWAIPEAKAAEIVNGLDLIAEEFKLAKDKFMKNYDQAVQNWIKDNPGWEKIIATSVVNADYVASRIAFNWQVFKVVNPTGRKKALLEAGLQSEVSNLGGTLFDEISKEARNAFNRSFMSKSMITRKALSPLKNIQQKLYDLSFVEPKVAPVASLIQSALDKIPGRGAISGTTLLMLNGLLTLLNDTSALATYAQEIIDGRSNNDSVLDALVKPDKAKEDTKPKKSEDKKQAKNPSSKLESYGLW
ncbi:MAG: DUF3150 domain-containing protein [Victivallaceae bacterium]|nr:DUF3150 domain-containing protein [Victivallaceae bacterium]